MIKLILYERIEQKNEIERELFSKLTPEERHAARQILDEVYSLYKQVRKEEDPKMNKDLA